MGVNQMKKMFHLDFIYLFIIVIIILPFISMHKCHVAPLETKFVLPCLKVEPLHVT
jgi:hypothetical protein